MSKNTLTIIKRVSQKANLQTTYKSAEKETSNLKRKLSNLNQYFTEMFLFRRV